MKVPDKNRPNKEVAIQFNLPGNKIATWKKQGKNISSFLKFIAEMTKSRCGTIRKDQ